jgi:hypothetical protein
MMLSSIGSSRLLEPTAAAIATTAVAASRVAAAVTATVAAVTTVSATVVGTLTTAVDAGAVEDCGGGQHLSVVTSVFGQELLIGTALPDYATHATDEKQGEENAYDDLEHVSPR